jgi:hypothetical protein
MYGAETHGFKNILALSTPISRVFKNMNHATKIVDPNWTKATEHSKIAWITREIRGPITSFCMLVVLVIVLAILRLSNELW